MNSALPFFLLPLLPVAGALPEAVSPSSTDSVAPTPPALVAPALPTADPAAPAPASVLSPIQPAACPAPAAEPSPADSAKTTPCATAATTRGRQTAKIS